MLYLNNNSRQKLGTAIGLALVFWGCFRLLFGFPVVTFPFADVLNLVFQRAVYDAAMYVVPVAAIYAGIEIASGSARTTCLVVCSVGIVYALLAAYDAYVDQLYLDFDSPIFVMMAVGDVVIFPAALLYLLLQSRWELAEAADFAACQPASDAADWDKKLRTIGKVESSQKPAAMIAQDRSGLAGKDLIVIFVLLGFCIFLVAENSIAFSSLYVGCLGVLCYLLWKRRRSRLNPALKSSRDSLAVAERLAQSDPGNAQFQRYLSASYDSAGNVEMAQGDLAGALKSYRDSLAVLQKLAQSNPDNAGWQRDLAISHEKLAEVYRRSNDRGNAVATLQKGEAIMQRLMKLSPDNDQLRRDFARLDNQIASLTKQATTQY